MIAAYREPDHTRGCELMTDLIVAISAGVPKDVTEAIRLGRTISSAPRSSWRNVSGNNDIGLVDDATKRVLGIRGSTAWLSPGTIIISGPGILVLAVRTSGGLCQTLRPA